MNVLVTGGTGVLGTAVIPALLAAGHKVRLLSRHAEREAGSFPEGVTPYVADVAKPGDLAGAVAGCDGVLHIAGIAEEQPPEITFEDVNVRGTQHLVEAAASSGQPWFVFVSSLGADRGTSDYHRSKKRAENCVRTYPGRWVIVRLGNVYGPGDETLSTLLKMVRTLPAVPMVGRGDQPFQPMWYADVGHLLAQILERPELNRQVLEVAGTEVTTTAQLLDRLDAITGRKVPRLSVPVWMTEIGVQALESFGAFGKKILRDAGMDAPLNSAKLTMLIEENVIGPASRNALTDFISTPTSLDDGLPMLADLIPEMLPGDGVGPLQQSTYWADIKDANVAATALLDAVCDNIHAVMPIEFAAEPGTPHRAEEGTTLTASLRGRGNIQVKLVERTENRATFVTLEGHPLAGVMQLHAEDIEDGVRFSVHIAAQAANALDWVAMLTVGGPMQRANWRAVVRRVVELSRGHAPAGVQYEQREMSSDETGDLRKYAERIVQRQQREQLAHQVAAGS